MVLSLQSGQMSLAYLGTLEGTCIHVTESAAEVGTLVLGGLKRHRTASSFNGSKRKMLMLLKSLCFSSCLRFVPLQRNTLSRPNYCFEQPPRVNIYIIN